MGRLIAAKSCVSRKFDFSFTDAGDGVAWLVRLLAGVVCVAAMLGIEVCFAPRFWVYVLIAIPILILFSIPLLRPMNGVMLAQHRRTDSHQWQIEK